MNDEEQETLHEIEELLRDAQIESAGEEASRIVNHVRGQAPLHRALDLAHWRADGAPLGYVLGTVRFMGVELLAGPGALSPRAETELLGARVLELLSARSPGGGGLRVIDMCCGAGNLACGLAVALPKLRVYASDVTDGCVALSRRNVERLGLQGRVLVAQGDLFAALAGHGLEGATSAVVCNPPYISTGRLQKDRAPLLRYEPREAFDGGPYGLSIQRRVIEDAAGFLEPGGWLLMEIGLGQERQLRGLFERSRSYEALETTSDAAGAARVTGARRKVAGP